jgi:hypothetical protein
MTSKQVIIGSAGLLLLAASIVTNVALQRGDAAPEQATAIAALEKDLAAAGAQAEKTLGEKGELEAKVAELGEELERQKASAKAAWESRQVLFDELAALETKLNEELEKLAKSDEEDQKEDETDFAERPLMEVWKAAFTGDFIKTAMRMQLPMQLKNKYGKFLDEYVQDPAQRAEVEALISAMLQAEMNILMEAFAAYPDMSKLKNLEADQEANKDMLQASLSAVLEPWQMEAFEGLGGGGRRDVEASEDRREASAAGGQARMAGMKLNEEQMAAFKEIMREESAGSVWSGSGLPTAADDLDLLATLTVGEFISKQEEQAELTAQRLAEVLPPEEVDKYRAFTERQREQFRMQLEMLSALSGG